MSIHRFNWNVLANPNDLGLCNVFSISNCQMHIITSAQQVLCFRNFHSNFNRWTAIEFNWIYGKDQLKSFLSYFLRRLNSSRNYEICFTESVCRVPAQVPNRTVAGAAAIRAKNEENPIQKPSAFFTIVISNFTSTFRSQNNSSFNPIFISICLLSHNVSHPRHSHLQLAAPDTLA